MNTQREVVSVRCHCGATVERNRTTGGRKTVRCDDCLRAANRESARRSNARVTTAGRREINRLWRELNRGSYRESARKWAKRNRANVTSNTQAYRARKLSAYVHHVDREVVYIMDAGVCGICSRPVSRANFHVDHIVPLARGGEHSYFNCQVAHPRCNRIKNARLA